MTIRRLVGWVWIALFFAIGIFAYFANPAVSFIYFILGITYSAFVFIKYCAECTNAYCPFNKNSVDFIIGRRNISVKAEYSDIFAAKASMPLAALMLFTLYFIWLWSPFVVISLILLAVLNMVAYTTTSCRFCTNNCPNNRNKEYWEWKTSSKLQKDIKK